MTAAAVSPLPTDANREAWLIAAVQAMTPWFAEIERDVPPVRVSVGWPGGRAPKSTTRGQCWSTGSAEDGVNQIFVSPWQVDTETTLAVLLHEMVHAVDDCVSGHSGDFIKIARALGFTAKWTSSDNRTEELSERLHGLAERLGTFPSAAIVSGRAADTPAKQGTRMIKAECPATDYKVRLTQKWIDEYGAPICPCCNETMEVAQ